MTTTLNASTAGAGGFIATGDNSGSLALQTAGTTAVTIDTSQNVGIGTATPLYTAANRQTTTINGGAGGAMLSFGISGTGKGSIFQNNSDILNISGYPNAVTFSSGVTDVERMRIDSSGNVLVQTTSASFNSGVGMKMIPDASGPAIVCVGTATTASFNSYFIYSTGAGANRFYVSYAGQIYATSTGITAISDVTLKENIRDLETGLNEVMALKPRRFDWKEETKLDQKNVAGFIAQEVEPVLPDLVYDYKYNEETTKKAVKMSDMLPTLVKAIQELKAINDTQAETINALTARIVALETA
jgi:hypothetical protein